jgi:hypothetical protein
VLQRNYKRFWVDVFRNIEEIEISVKVRDVAPVLCIVAVEIVVGVMLCALEILTRRWRRFCALRQSRWKPKRR